MLLLLSFHACEQELGGGVYLDDVQFLAASFTAIDCVAI